eukprot:TRINITY_DN13227_c0_g1_i8.p1 TRINITY_DN13227_c0_g1~~TRINITY_DN13227_c0_g1_i8.p1  ORF type:complete len:134 (+),score=18.56 TRINITY_DN13227_c0_g1_i8:54-455(+)
MADLNILISNIATEISNNLGLAVAISALLVVLAALFTFLAVSFALRGSKRDAIVLLGPCGAGKTALYFQLRDGSTHEGTVSSMESNEGRFIYDVLRKRTVAQRRIPILVACNKTDKVTAHSVDFIRKQLEKEM